MPVQAACVAMLLATELMMPLVEALQELQVHLTDSNDCVCLLGNARLSVLDCPFRSAAAVDLSLATAWLLPAG